MQSEKEITGERLTAEQHLEEFLRNSQGVLSLVLDNIPAAIMVVDRKAGCVYLNHECTGLTGYTFEDVRADQKALSDICGEAVKCLSTGATPRQGWGGAVVDKELSVRCKGGRSMPIHMRAAALTGENVIVTLSDSAVAGYIGLMRAVVDDAKKEEEFRGSENEFRTLAEKSLSLTGVFLIQEGFIRYANSRFAETFGYAVKELIDRKRPQDLMPPEEWADLERQMEKERSTDKPVSVHREFRGITKSGEVIYVEIYGSFTTAGGRSAIIGTLLDITKRKTAEEMLRKAEEKYRNIFENSTLGIYQTAQDGRFLAANHSAARILGYDSPEELMKSVTDIGQSFVSEEKRAEFNQLIREQEFVEGFEVEMRKKDGSVNWVSLSTRSVSDGPENGVYYEGTLQDIAGRKNLESQILQSQKMEAIGTLAGGVAHDFNNLLMGIQGHTTLMLLKTDKGHEYYDRLKSVEQLVKSAADLTKQLLGFARGGRYQVKVTNISEVLKNVSAMFMRTKKEITVHEKYDDDLYPVEMDQSQIEQAFLNLYVNAWQAMPGGGHLYIEARNVTLDRNYLRSRAVHPGRYIEVSVTDTGVGMDEKTMKRIFDPFFTTKEMGRGTGLGLASVYGIVKGHKGFINVYSQVGHGTTFNVYLPGSKKGAEAVTQVPEELIRGTETILLVDDEEVITKVGKEILEALGYGVITASGGREAVEVYRADRQEIALVILDMIMPDLEGGKTFDELKSVNPAVKVILSSGYSLNGEAEGIMRRGCKAFMQKPFNVYALSRTVREVIDSAS